MSQKRTLLTLVKDGVLFRKVHGNPQKAATTFKSQEMLEAVWKEKLDNIYGDRLNQPPPAGRYIFGCCSALEAAFLFINLTTTSPFLFERCMPYHIKYTALSLGFWGATYNGLDMARYNNFRGPWRTLMGVGFFIVGTGTLVMADYNPWPSYVVLTGSYAVMAAYDYRIHTLRQVPPWIFRWKTSFNIIAFLSLVIGIAKGKYLENNAEWYIMREAARQLGEED